MKRIVLVGLGILLVIGAAHAADTDTGSRTFNSQLSLEIWILRTLDGDEEQIGATPSEAPLEIPECRYWWVHPRIPVDMDKLTQEIRSKRIPGLELSDTTDDDLAHLKALTGLRTLNLWGLNITDAGVAHLKGLTSLRELNLPGNITDVGLAHLKGLTGLLELDLSDTNITDAGIAHLKDMTSLQTLDLSNTDITDAGMAPLKDLTGLQELLLSSKKITDAGMAHLKDMTSLQVLDFRGTNITHRGRRELEAALPETSIH